MPCPEDVAARCPHGEAPPCPWCAAAGPPGGLDRGHLGLSEWPCSLLLGQAVVQRAWNGLSVVEVGCGLAHAGRLLVGWAASVALLDADEAVCAHLAGTGGSVGADLLCLSWRDPPPRKWDAVIGSDLLTEEGDAHALACWTAAAWTGKGPCLFALPRRGQPWVFGEALARETGRQVRVSELRGTLPGGAAVACDLWEV